MNGARITIANIAGIAAGIYTESFAAWVFVTAALIVLTLRSEDEI